MNKNQIVSIFSLILLALFFIITQEPFPLFILYGIAMVVMFFKKPTDQKQDGESNE